MKPTQVTPPPIKEVKKSLNIILETHQIIVEILKRKARANLAIGYALGFLTAACLSLILN